LKSPLLNSGAFFKNRKHTISYRLPLYLFTDVCGGSWIQIVFVTTFCLYACGLDVEDSSPPSSPKWVHKSIPAAWPEHGVDAHESQGIHLEWEPNSPDEEIIEYLIYRSTYFDVSDSIGDFEFLAIRITASDPSSEYIDQSAVTGAKYHFKIKARDSGGNTSEFSAELFYTLLPQITSAAMWPNGLKSPLPVDRGLSWVYQYSVAMEDYCITILDIEDTFVWRSMFSPSNYTGNNQSWTIPVEVILNTDRIYKWRVDMGAQYVDGMETAGSESAWATFLYTSQ
jgi:hypothetical protein